ncbi:MAG: YebC/PmpR family DNA-binding transcriptional regulator [Oligoflexales bacterium]|nr:YebC/PmpR family DNA-binding transcriptional regulator [Oligoflexales bacterium]
MAGHSKWKNIQHRKGAQDARRGKIFTKIGLEITVAVRISGKDPESNPRLRLALNKARAENMPKDNIERAIKKGAGELGDASTYTEKVYEGYGPNGIAVIVECLTDNVNRTVSEVRHAFSRNGGNLGTDGSVAWMFHSKGQIIYGKDKIRDFDRLFEYALEHGAEDLKDQEDSYEIICEPSQFNELKQKLDEFLKIDADFAEVTRIAENTTALGVEESQALMKLVDALEDKDDVQNVYHNGDLADDV